MCQFVETICFENGVMRNLCYHEARLNATRLHFWKGSVPIALGQYLGGLPNAEGRQKVRVVYGEYGVMEVTMQPYTMRRIASLRLINNDTIDYSFKSTERSALNALAAQREECDEVLIVRRGEITDTSYTNVAFLEGKQWYTPARPLLCGTMRASLLDAGSLTERIIRCEDLGNYSAIMLFNAMISFGELTLAIGAIVK